MPRVKTDLRIHEEISTLANKVSDLETQLKEEKKVISTEDCDYII
jgi:predicted RNase H-like nuclease (RuvC/YqgF family)